MPFGTVITSTEGDLKAEILQGESRVTITRQPSQEDPKETIMSMDPRFVAEMYVMLVESGFLKGIVISRHGRLYDACNMREIQALDKIDKEPPLYLVPR